jgi:hypothetical protein
MWMIHSLIHHSDSCKFEASQEEQVRHQQTLKLPNLY